MTSSVVIEGMRYEYKRLSALLSVELCGEVVVEEVKSEREDHLSRSLGGVIHLRCVCCIT